MMSHSFLGTRVSQRRWGGLLVVVGLLANPYVIGWLAAPDGSIDGEARVRLIYFFDVFLALSGAALVWERPRRWFGAWIANAALAAVAIAALSAALVGSWWGITAYRGAHHHTMDMAHLQPPTDEQRRWADEFVARCWQSARRHGWFDFEKARQDGFELQWGDREHYVNRAFVFDQAVLDPDRPEFLMFRATPRGNLLVGFMFFTRTLEEHGPQPGGSLTPWHYHPWNGRGYCAEGGILPVSRPDAQGRCLVGERVSRSAEMLHVWFVDHPLGPYADAMLFPDSTTVLDATLIHPMVVHFAIALFIIAVVLDLGGRMASSDALHRAAFTNLVFAALFAVATIAAGMLAEVRLLIAPDVHHVLDTHKLLGFSAAAGIVVLLAWRLAYRGALPARGARVYLALSLVVAAAIGTAGYFGSELVYVHGLAVQAIDRDALNRLERGIASRAPASSPSPAPVMPAAHVHAQ